MKITAGFVLLASAGFVAAQDVQANEARTIFGPGGLLDLLIPKPLVTSYSLQSHIKSNKLLDHAKQLVKFSKLNGGSTRAFGSVGHNSTLTYFKKLLDDTKYYDTSYQTFPYLYSQGTAAFSANGTDYKTAWFTYGVAGEVEAPVILVNDLGCTLADFPEAVVGKIALIKRGQCEFGLKVALAGAAGAAGSIIYNNAGGSLSGTLGQISRAEGPYIPAGSLSGEDGEALRATIAAGSQVIGKIHVDATNEQRWSSNLFAVTKTGDKQNIVMAGAHSDSVAAGPGINDDGSGSMGVLEIALNLPKYKVKNAVRFAWWTAEEFGLVGSEHYVANLSEAERQKIALYLNFDMIASPNFGYFIHDGDGSTFNVSGAAGSDHIERTFEKFYASNKVKSAPTEFSGRSDYGPFLDANIPAGGVNTGAEGIKTAEEAKWWGGKAGDPYDICYHAACDGIENLNVPAFVMNTKAAAHAIATYARSLTGIPRPRPAATNGLRVSKLSYDDRRHQGCGHEVLTA
ncbi:hypothetical protein D9613_006614 [Agrocybe pediades]|uniref:Peptide hydrolase n=1 Tax=Agrocybe pediades TaxID=84607 RepID=A0A8H4QH06_9AGAR|nr:hypothetical protein D9613_006614 [Agrocybe pediades]